MSQTTVTRVAKTFYISTEVIEIIGRYAEEHGLSESDAAKILIREGVKELKSPSHDPKACKACGTGRVL